MFVTVIAMNEGFDGARRGRRFFANGEAVRLEVLDQEDDPPDVSSADGKRMIPDPERIGRRTYQVLRDDPRIKLLSDGETVAVHSRAAFEEARRAAEKSAVEAVGLKLEVARLQDENSQLRRQMGELQKSLLPPDPGKADEPDLPTPVVTPPAAPTPQSHSSPPNRRR